MSPPMDSPPVALMLNLAVGGTILSLFVLATEYYGWQRVGLRLTALGGLALLLLAGGLLVGAAELDTILPCAAVGAVALGGAAVRTPACRQLLGRLTRPAVIWGAVLVASLGGALYVRHAATATLQPDDLPLQASATFHHLEEIVAITDRGRELLLCAYDESG